MKEQAARLGLPAILHTMEVLQGALDRLRGGVSRRVEMEMAVIRLCDPRLDDGTAALLHRIDALEAAVKNGLPAAPVIPAAIPAAEPVAEPIPAPAAEPIPAPEPPPVEAVIPAPEAPAVSEEVPFVLWTQVLEQLQRTCPPLHGVLWDSTALEKDGALIICTENALFTSLLKDEGNKKMMADALQQVAGRSFRMKLRRTQQVEKAEADPLSQLLASGRGAGIHVNEK